MTIRYRRGMTLGEFEAMIEEHRREQGERFENPPACEHPFDPDELELGASKVDGGLEIRVVYRCECGAKWGARKMLRTKRKAKA